MVMTWKESLLEFEREGLVMKRSGDEEPEPPGGRAAERLREFLRERLPVAAPSDESQLEDAPKGASGTKDSPCDKDQKPGR